MEKLFRQFSSAVRQHPSASVLIVTSVTGSFVYSYYNMRTRNYMLRVHEQLREEVSATCQDCTAKLKKLDGQWNADMRKKDRFLQTLETQVIEQERSTHRLEKALKQCAVEISELKMSSPPSSIDSTLQNSHGSSANVDYRNE